MMLVAQFRQRTSRPRASPGTARIARQRRFGHMTRMTDSGMCPVFLGLWAGGAYDARYRMDRTSMRAA